MTGNSPTTIADRESILTNLRDLKMARSVHAYVRGNTAKFYEWLAISSAARSIPKGPAIWICGDCHLGNLGPIADADGCIDFQIRDLDQTVIGNPALDLVRLGLSLEAAARSSDLPGITTARMIEAMVASYSLALGGVEKERKHEPDLIRTVRKRAAGRQWRHLAAERLEGGAPDIPLGKAFWRLDKNERSEIEGLFDEPDVRERALEIAGVSSRARLRVLDAAYWRKGCSSLGNLRYAVLLGIRADRQSNELYGLIDIKEAVAPLAPHVKMPKTALDQAQRVVAGASALSPNLGSRMIAANLMGKPVVLRELKPQDMKLELEQFSRKEAVRAAGYLSFVVGRAHARQLDETGKRAWLATFDKGSADAGAAPSWLWQAVVDLAGAHEIGYLEHCRKVAG